MRSKELVGFELRHGLRDDGGRRKSCWRQDRVYLLRPLSSL